MSTPMSQAGQFKALVQWLRDALRSPEQFTLDYNAEASEFIRFNKGKVRQAGLVQQASLSLKLIDNGRHADVSITHAGGKVFVYNINVMDFYAGSTLSPAMKI